MTWVPALAEKSQSKKEIGRVSVYAYTQVRRTRGVRGPETRTELSHQIPSQESRTPKDRDDLSRDRAPAGRAILDGWLLVGVFAGQDVMVASLRRNDC
jgi:hypothetical protein